MGPEKWEMGFKRGFSRLKCGPQDSSRMCRPLPPSLPSLLRRAAPITQNNMQWQTTWASSELVVKLLNAIGLDASFLYRAEITTVAWISTLTICPGPALLRFANNFAQLCKYLWCHKILSSLAQESAPRQCPELDFFSSSERARHYPWHRITIEGDGIIRWAPANEEGAHTRPRTTTAPRGNGVSQFTDY